MGRTPCCDKSVMKKGPWTPEEDKKLVAYINKHGQGNWHAIPKNAGLARCGKSCRLRWNNYLRPGIKRGHFSSEEEDTIILLHGILGNKWSTIAAWLPGRTDNEIKNHWNTNIRKRVLRMGVDLVTNEPAPCPNLIISAAAPYSYPYAYPAQATADLDTLHALALQPLANNHYAPAMADQQLLPWTLQPATMAQQVVPPLPQVEQHACQLPDLMQMVHTNPTAVQQHQLAAAQAQQQPPMGNVVGSLLDVSALMQMQMEMEMAQAANESNLQQWSSMV